MEVEMARAKTKSCAWAVAGPRSRRRSVSTPWLERESLERAGILSGLPALGMVAARDQHHGAVIRRGQHLMRVDAGVELALRDRSADRAVGVERCTVTLLGLL